ncbi:hypothetical protein BCR44DRAFT_1482032 [Catenaria anguillulae PL171]|uniref:Uncharacterized protein n=1 Tax=Catenaria anguillulae PL171 TaxID=765915 RepID=A0A1Y2I2J6_9FUNG|nr:hypothetical protein BCR44DRAFT_1482032 [Catenaria anguillulae PL171]
MRPSSAKPSRRPASAAANQSDTQPPTSSFADPWAISRAPATHARATSAGLTLESADSLRPESASSGLPPLHSGRGRTAGHSARKSKHASAHGNGGGRSVSAGPGQGYRGGSPLMRGKSVGHHGSGQTSQEVELTGTYSLLDPTVRRLRVREKTYDVNLVSTHMPVYEPLLDGYLQDYFNTPSIRSHLLALGIIDEEGYIVDEHTFKYAQLALDRRERDNMLARASQQRDMDREVEVTLRQGQERASSSSPRHHRPGSASRHRQQPQPSQAIVDEDVLSQAMQQLQPASTQAPSAANPLPPVNNAPRINPSGLPNRYNLPTSVLSRPTTRSNTAANSRLGSGASISSTLHQPPSAPRPIRPKSAFTKGLPSSSNRLAAQANGDKQLEPALVRDPVSEFRGDYDDPGSDPSTRAPSRASPAVARPVRHPYAHAGHEAGTLPTVQLALRDPVAEFHDDYADAGFDSASASANPSSMGSFVVEQPIVGGVFGVIDASAGAQTRDAASAVQQQQLTTAEMGTMPSTSHLGVLQREEGVQASARVMFETGAQTSEVNLRDGMVQTQAKPHVEEMVQTSQTRLTDAPATTTSSDPPADTSDKESIAALREESLHIIKSMQAIPGHSRDPISRAILSETYLVTARIAFLIDTNRVATESATLSAMHYAVDAAGSGGLLRDIVEFQQQVIAHWKEQQQQQQVRPVAPAQDLPAKKRPSSADVLAAADKAVPQSAVPELSHAERMLIGYIASLGGDVDGVLAEVRRSKATTAQVTAPSSNGSSEHQATQEQPQAQQPAPLAQSPSSSNVHRKSNAQLPASRPRSLAGSQTGLAEPSVTQEPSTSPESHALRRPASDTIRYVQPPGTSSPYAQQAVVGPSPSKSAASSRHGSRSQLPNASSTSKLVAGGRTSGTATPAKSAPRSGSRHGSQASLKEVTAVQQPPESAFDNVELLQRASQEDLVVKQLPQMIQDVGALQSSPDAAQPEPAVARVFADEARTPPTISAAVSQVLFAPQPQPNAPAQNDVAAEATEAIQEAVQQEAQGAHASHSGPLADSTFVTQMQDPPAQEHSGQPATIVDQNLARQDDSAVVDSSSIALPPPTAGSRDVLGPNTNIPADHGGGQDPTPPAAHPPPSAQKKSESLDNIDRSKSRNQSRELSKETSSSVAKSIGGFGVAIAAGAVAAAAAVGVMFKSKSNEKVDQQRIQSRTLVPESVPARAASQGALSTDSNASAPLPLESRSQHQLDPARVPLPASTAASTALLSTEPQPVSQAMPTGQNQQSDDPLESSPDLPSNGPESPASVTVVEPAVELSARTSEVEPTDVPLPASVAASQNLASSGQPPVPETLSENANLKANVDPAAIALPVSVAASAIVLGTPAEITDVPESSNTRSNLDPAHIPLPASVAASQVLGPNTHGQPTIINQSQNARAVSNANLSVPSQAAPAKAQSEPNLAPVDPTPKARSHQLLSIDPENVALPASIAASAVLLSAASVAQSRRGLAPQQEQVVLDPSAVPLPESKAVSIAMLSPETPAENQTRAQVHNAEGQEQLATSAQEPTDKVSGLELRQSPNEEAVLIPRPQSVAPSQVLASSQHDLHRSRELAHNSVDGKDPHAVPLPASAAASALILNLQPLSSSQPTSSHQHLDPSRVPLPPSIAASAWLLEPLEHNVSQEQVTLPNTRTADDEPIRVDPNDPALIPLPASVAPSRNLLASQTNVAKQPITATQLNAVTDPTQMPLPVSVAASALVLNEQHSHTSNERTVHMSAANLLDAQQVPLPASPSPDAQPHSLSHAVSPLTIPLPASVAASMTLYPSSARSIEVLESPMPASSPHHVAELESMSDDHNPASVPLPESVAASQVLHSEPQVAQTAPLQRASSEADPTSIPLPASVAVSMILLGSAGNLSSSGQGSGPQSSAQQAVDPALVVLPQTVVASQPLAASDMHLSQATQPSLQPEFSDSRIVEPAMVPLPASVAASQALSGASQSNVHLSEATPQMLDPAAVPLPHSVAASALVLNDPHLSAAKASTLALGVPLPASTVASRQVLIDFQAQPQPNSVTATLDEDNDPGVREVLDPSSIPLPHSVAPSTLMLSDARNTIGEPTDAQVESMSHNVPLASSVATSLNVLNSQAPIPSASTSNVAGTPQVVETKSGTLDVHDPTFLPLPQSVAASAIVLHGSTGQLAEPTSADIESMSCNVPLPASVANSLNVLNQPPAATITAHATRAIVVDDDNDPGVREAFDPTAIPLPQSVAASAMILDKNADTLSEPTNDDIESMSQNRLTSFVKSSDHVRDPAGQVPPESGEASTILAHSHGQLQVDPTAIALPESVAASMILAQPPGPLASDQAPAQSASFAQENIASERQPEAHQYTLPDSVAGSLDILGQSDATPFQPPASVQQHAIRTMLSSTSLHGSVNQLNSNWPPLQPQVGSWLYDPAAIPLPASVAASQVLVSTSSSELDYGKTQPNVDFDASNIPLPESVAASQVLSLGGENHTLAETQPANKSVRPVSASPLSITPRKQVLASNEQLSSATKADPHEIALPPSAATSLQNLAASQPPRLAKAPSRSILAGSRASSMQSLSGKGSKDVLAKKKDSGSQQKLASSRATSVQSLTSTPKSSKPRVTFVDPATVPLPPSVASSLQQLSSAVTAQEQKQEDSIASLQLLAQTTMPADTLPVDAEIVQVQPSTDVSLPVPLPASRNSLAASRNLSKSDTRLSGSSTRLTAGSNHSEGRRSQGHLAKKAELDPSAIALPPSAPASMHNLSTASSSGSARHVATRASTSVSTSSLSQAANTRLPDSVDVLSTAEDEQVVSPVKPKMPVAAQSIKSPRKPQFTASQPALNQNHAGEPGEGDASKSVLANRNKSASQSSVSGTSKNSGAYVVRAAKDGGKAGGNKAEATPKREAKASDKSVAAGGKGEATRSETAVQQQ